MECANKVRDGKYRKRVGYVEGMRRQLCYSCRIEDLDAIWKTILKQWANLSISGIEKIYEKQEVIWGDGSHILTLLFKTKKGKFIGMSGFWKEDLKSVCEKADTKIVAKTYKELIDRWYKPFRDQRARVKEFERIRKLPVDKLFKMIGLTPRQLKSLLLEQINHLRRHAGEIEMVEEDLERGQRDE